MEKLFEDIQIFFPEFRITVRDLKNPTTTFIRDFYCRVLMELGVDVENVRKVQIEQMEYAQDIDLIPEFNLVTAIQTAMPFLNFCLADLLFPEIKRNVHLMSFVMEFLDFCDRRCSIHNEKIEEFHEAKKKERNLDNIQQQESNSINNIACEIDQNNQAAYQLKEICGQLQHEVEQYTEEEAKLREKASKLKEDVISKENKIQSINREIQAVIAECEEFKKMIVDNPDEEKRDYDVKSRERTRVLEKKKAYQDKLKALNADKEKFQKKAEDLSKIINPILNNLHYIQDYSEAKKIASQAEETLQDLLERKEELISQSKMVDGQIQDEKEIFSAKISELEQNETSLQECIAQKNDELKVKLKECKKAKKKSQEEYETGLNRIYTLEKEYKELLFKFNTVTSDIHCQKEVLLINS